MSVALSFSLGSTALAQDGESSGIAEAPAGETETADCSVVVIPARDAERLRLREVELRLSTLEEERAAYGIAGPLAMMIAGFVVAANGVTFLSIGGVFNHDESLSREGNNYIYAGAAMLGAGGIVGVIGAIWFKRRKSRRNANVPEILELRRERDQIRDRLIYGFNLAPGRLNLRLGWSF